MDKIVKKFAIGIIVVAIIIAAVSYKINGEKTVFNESMINGNTTGNLYGEGLFCQADDVVYFSNPNDNGALYSMSVNETDVKKICNDRAYYINSDPHYIYYCRNNNNDESSMSFLNVNIHSLCRINTNGKQVKILDDAVSQGCSLSQNTVVYYHYDDEEATTIYTIGIDGENKQQLINEAINPLCLDGDKLFYAGVSQDHKLHCKTLSTGATSQIGDINAWLPIVDGGYVYYIDLDNSHKISKFSLSDSSVTNISKQEATSYLIAGNSIFYQTMKSDKDGVYKIDLTTMEETLVAPGQFKNLNATSKFLYMVDYNSGAVYHCSIKGGSPSVFNPPIELEK